MYELPVNFGLRSVTTDVVQESPCTECGWFLAPTKVESARCNLFHCPAHGEPLEASRVRGEFGPCGPNGAYFDADGPGKTPYLIAPRQVELSLVRLLKAAAHPTVDCASCVYCHDLEEGVLCARFVDPVYGAWISTSDCRDLFGPCGPEATGFDALANLRPTEQTG